MAVVNRTLDGSEQRKVLSFNSGLVIAGVTLSIAQIPQPMTLQAVQVSASGISTGLSGILAIQRFIVGSGLTVINIGSSFAFVDYGVSGVIAAGVSLPAAGSTVLNLLANDVVTLKTTGSNGAAMTASVNLVLLPTQDIRTYFGLV